jgi:hypothetical protein
VRKNVKLPFRLRRHCFHPHSRAVGYSTAFFIKLIAGVLLLGKKAVYSHSAECEILIQLNPSISLADIVMVGAALSREFIAHECAPTEMPNIFDESL